MLKNTRINLLATKKVATALGDLNPVVVFIGGAVVSFYIDDPAAADVRPTKDIDIGLQITTIPQLEEIREMLIARGFKQSHQDDVTCRFRVDDVLVDVMSTQEIGWAPANPWFKPGLPYLIQQQIEGITINLLPLPYFLATKFSAFYSRGGSDPRVSQDFEDIVYIMNYRSDFLVQIEKSDRKVRDYLAACCKDIAQNSDLQEAIVGNLYYEEQEYGFKKIMQYVLEIARFR